MHKPWRPETVTKPVIEQPLLPSQERLVWILVYAAYLHGLSEERLQKKRAAWEAKQKKFLKNCSAWQLAEWAEANPALVSWEEYRERKQFLFGNYTFGQPWSGYFRLAEREAKTWTADELRFLLSSLPYLSFNWQRTRLNWWDTVLHTKIIRERNRRYDELRATNGFHEVLL